MQTIGGFNLKRAIATSPRKKDAMVYSQKFVSAVIVSGKVVRDVRDKDGDFVRLPFGSEYSLRLKNLHGTRAVVKISIDGQDALDGNSLVINPNQSMDLEGFMKGNSAVNKFKFIEKTQKISEHRGDRIDDGIIQVQWQFEKPKPEVQKVIIEHHDHYYRDWYRDWYPYIPYPYHHGTWCSTGGGASGSSGGNVEGREVTRSMKSSCFSHQPDGISQDSLLCSYSNPVNEDGITVKGSQINQQFNTTYVNELEEEVHTMIIKIVGTNSKEEKIAEPVFVATKVVCETCGKKNTSRDKFCPECGTSLI